ncbi:hypothetical protein [Nocardia sp. NPDC057353]|uniref:hypothetical protein n=1 Tax=Nocardia sp. NPDC057353 TaxID=3346104 RepID=UPI0036420E0B
MTTGVGISMGSATSVTASATTGQPRPSVRVRPTAIAFDSRGTAGIGAPGVARVGADAEWGGPAANFADLTAKAEPVVVAGRLWTPAALVAAAVRDLLHAEQVGAGVALAHPAVYRADDIDRLAQALDLAGVGHVLPVPEPVAATEWLEHETGPLGTGFVLVYDLGATSLDLGVVRVGPDWPDHPIVGTPVRSRDFGGEPLGALIAEQAYRRPGSPGIRGLDTEGLRAEHIRASFPLVLDCLAGSGLDPVELTGILLVGGAARPPEVARTLGELGLPVLRGADPGHTVALGAAHFAVRTLAPPLRRAEPVAPIGVFSSAALVSALAMSAATVFGGPAAQSGPSFDRFLPGQGVALVPGYGSASAGGWGAAALGSAVVPGGGVPVAVGGPVVPGSPGAATVRVFGPPLTPVSRGGRGGDGVPRSASEHCTYANPARFTNPLPFLQRFGFGLDERRGIGPGWGTVGVGAVSPGAPPAGPEGAAAPVAGETSAGAAGTSGASPAGAESGAPAPGGGVANSGAVGASGGGPGAEGSGGAPNAGVGPGDPGPGNGGPGAAGSGGGGSGGTGTGGTGAVGSGDAGGSGGAGAGSGGDPGGGDSSTGSDGDGSTGDGGNGSGGGDGSGGGNGSGGGSGGNGSGGGNGGSGSGGGDRGSGSGGGDGGNGGNGSGGGNGGGGSGGDGGNSSGGGGKAGGSNARDSGDDSSGDRGGSGRNGSDRGGSGNAGSGKAGKGGSGGGSGAGNSGGSGNSGGKGSDR